MGRGGGIEEGKWIIIMNVWLISKLYIGGRRGEQVNIVNVWLSSSDHLILKVMHHQH